MADNEAIISDLSPAAAVALSDKIELEQGEAPNNSGAYGTLQQLKDLFAQDLRHPVITVDIVAGVVTFDLANGVNKYFVVLLDEDVDDVDIINLPGAGFAAELDVDWVQDAVGGRTVAIPANFRGLGDTEVTVGILPSEVTVMSAVSKDNGGVWRYAMQESA